MQYHQNQMPYGLNGCYRLTHTLDLRFLFLNSYQEFDTIKCFVEANFLYPFAESFWIDSLISEIFESDFIWLNEEDISCVRQLL